VDPVPLRRSSGPAAAGEPRARMVQISKSFVGTHAVRGVDLEVTSGEVHALVGENGAGKSTLMRVLAGNYADYFGNIYINGALERIETPRRARQLGVAMVHQELSLVPELSVAENMFLGREASSKIPGLIDRRATERRAEAILKEVEANLSPTDRVGSLSLAKQQLVEIAKGISTESRVLILDEPTSSLTQPEIDDLFWVVRTAKEKGVAIIYISHKLPEIFALSDRITVMRDGMKLSSRPVGEWREAELVREMVGRSLTEFFPRSHKSSDPTPVLEILSLSQEPYFVDVTFAVRRGEIVGIYGLIGSGRTRLAKAIFGLSRADSGEIRVNGKTKPIAKPAHGVEAGIALVPEDRRVQGLVHVLGVGNNLTLARLKALCTASFINGHREQHLVDKNVRDLNIKTASTKTPVSTLSGGNQQKVVLGKWLNTEPSLLILDEPTRGIDVGAKAEVRQKIDVLAEEGMAVLLISSELPEIMGMSDRILVMRGGRIIAEFARSDFSEEAIGAAAIAGLH
jgi:ABC-type sugar transport system ATPase subunit